LLQELKQERPSVHIKGVRTMFMQARRTWETTEDSAHFSDILNRIEARGWHARSADRVALRLAATEPLHPVAVGFGLSGFAVFLAASWLVWGRGETALLIAMITLLFAVYFGMLCGLAWHATAEAARRAGDAARRHRFAAFLAGHVDTLTGHLSGRSALMQIAFTPLLLGALMVVLGVLWTACR
jgi:hypothetical protein